MNTESNGTTQSIPPIFRSSVQVTTPSGKIITQPIDTTDSRGIIFVDLDNVVYSKQTRIAEQMGVLIKAYFQKLGLPEEEAHKLHMHYYLTYGLAIRGLVKHHQIDPLDYDLQCDSALPLEELLSPNVGLKKLLSEIDRSKYRVWALTNAFVTHAVRVLKLTDLHDQFEAVVSCDYRVEDFNCKPELAFYHEAVQATGQLDPSKNYFVDDSHTNIFGSYQFGFGHNVLFDEFGDLTEKLNELLEEDKKQTSDPKASNGNGNGNGHVAVGKGKVSIIRDVLELRSVWSEIFLKQAV